MRMLPVLLVLSLLVGCGPTFRARGQVVDPAGRPVGGVRMAHRTDRHISDAEAATVLTLFGIGYVLGLGEHLFTPAHGQPVDADDYRRHGVRSFDDGSFELRFGGVSWADTFIHAPGFHPRRLNWSGHNGSGPGRVEVTLRPLPDVPVRLIALTGLTLDADGGGAAIDLDVRPPAGVVPEDSSSIARDLFGPDATPHRMPWVIGGSEPVGAGTGRRRVVAGERPVDSLRLDAPLQGGRVRLHTSLPNHEGRFDGFAVTDARHVPRLAIEVPGLALRAGSGVGLRWAGDADDRYIDLTLAPIHGYTDRLDLPAVHRRIDVVQGAGVSTWAGHGAGAAFYLRTSDGRYGKGAIERLGVTGGRVVLEVSVYLNPTPGDRRLHDGRGGWHPSAGPAVDEGDWDRAHRLGRR